VYSLQYLYRIFQFYNATVNWCYMHAKHNPTLGSFSKSIHCSKRLGIGVFDFAHWVDGSQHAPDTRLIHFKLALTDSNFLPIVFIPCLSTIDNKIWSESIHLYRLLHSAIKIGLLYRS